MEHERLQRSLVACSPSTMTVLDIHKAMIWMLVVLVAVHVAGVLKHMLVDKDATFKCMWFFLQIELKRR